MKSKSIWLIKHDIGRRYMVVAGESSQQALDGGGYGPK